MQHASTVDIGERKRRGGGINEDSVATAVLENHHRQAGRSVGVFVLADGVGGESSGDVASFLATTIVRQHLTEALQGPATDVPEAFDLDAYGEAPPTVDAGESEPILSPDRIRSAIQEAVDEAHQHVQAYAREIGARPATTIVVGVYVDGHLHYGWVGDSRLYVVNGAHDEIAQLTRDHAVTNQLLQNGEIDHEEHARVHEDATAITNAIGGSGHGKPTVDVEFGSEEIYEDDVILVTSDGLVDAYPKVRPLRQAYEQADDTDEVREEIRETLVTDDEIRDIVLEADQLHAAVERLVSFANDRGGKDNLSISLASDPAADPTPDDLPERGVAVESDAEPDESRTADASDAGSSPTDGTGSADADGSGTADASADAGTGTAASSDDADSGAASDDASSDESSDDAVDVVSVGDGGPGSAAIAIPGYDVIFEVDGDVTVGRAADSESVPDIPLAVDAEAIIEPTHAAVVFDEDASAWRLADTSSSGTYVEVNDGEWQLLLSSEGAELHRQHGFDPGEAAERDIEESTELEEGTAFTLEDPRNDDAITCQFFGSVDRARRHVTDDAGAESGQFERFLT